MNTVEDRFDARWLVATLAMIALSTVAGDPGSPSRWPGWASC
jgi:hypothetical protein